MSGPIRQTPGASATLLLVALVLAVPVLLIPLADDEARAEWEKRSLVELPSISDFGSPKAGFAQLGEYLNDHVFGVLAVNRAYRRAQFELFGDAPIPNVVRGDDGLVFLTSHGANYPRATLNRFCSPNSFRIKGIARSLANLSEELRRYGVQLHVAIPPSKIALYADRLPPTVPVRHRHRCQSIAQKRGFAPDLLSSMAEGYSVIYPFEEQFRLRDTPHFYPPENFHADSRSTHEFARSFFRVAGIAGDISGLEPSLETVRADLKMMGFSRDIKAWRYRYRQQVKITRSPPSWVLSQFPTIKVTATYDTERPLSRRRAVLLSDSFGAFVAPHLAIGFEQILRLNIKSLGKPEAEQFLTVALKKTAATDVILLLHDAGLDTGSLQRFLEYSGLP
ncbi:MAG: hypothetical protein AAF756_03230 [Pseudomonadota bacterium]